MTTKQMRRAEGDWHRRMTGTMTMAAMFRWYLHSGYVGRKSTKLAAYIAARQYVTGGRIPLTIRRLPA